MVKRIQYFGIYAHRKHISYQFWKENATYILRHFLCDFKVLIYGLCVTHLRMSLPGMVFTRIVFTWQALLNPKDLVYSSSSEAFFLVYNSMQSSLGTIFISVSSLCLPSALFYCLSHTVFTFLLYIPPSSDYDILVGRHNVRFIFYCILSIKFSTCYSIATQ